MYDTVIIGSGPAGLSASIYAKREMLNFVILEKDFMGIGRIAESERVDNYLGLFGESGYNLGEKFRSHAENLGVEILETEVVNIIEKENYFLIECEDKTFIETRTIIYCTGACHKILDIKGEKNFIGKGVSYCAVCDAAFYENSVVAVIGGGDTALQDALILSRTADKVYLLHRRDKFRANKILVSKVKNALNIEILYNSTPIEIKGKISVEKLIINRNGNKDILNINGIFVAIGSYPNSKLLKDIVKLDDSGYILADETGKTSHNGIFVAGDVRTKDLRQVVTAVSDGANCVNSVEKYLLDWKKE